MADREIKRTGFPGTESWERSGVERRVHHDSPPCQNRIPQFTRPRQFAAAQHFVSHCVGYCDLTEELP